EHRHCAADGGRAPTQGGPANAVADAKRGGKAPLGRAPAPTSIALHSARAGHGLAPWRAVPTPLGPDRSRSWSTLPPTTRPTRERGEARTARQARPQNPRPPSPLAEARPRRMDRPLRRPTNQTVLDELADRDRACWAPRRLVAHAAAYAGDVDGPGWRADLGGGRLPRHDPGDPVSDLWPPQPGFPEPGSGHLISVPFACRGWNIHKRNQWCRFRSQRSWCLAYPSWHGGIHSIFTFAALMTSPHLAESLRKYLAKASSGPGTGCTAKRSRYFFWNSGSLMIFCTSALTFLMMSAGVPAAANSPNDTLASYPGTVSAMVGTSGNCGTRFSLPKASILSFPSFTELSATDGPIITASTCPAITSVSAGAAPR